MDLETSWLLRQGEGQEDDRVPSRGRGHGGSGHDEPSRG